MLKQYHEWLSHIRAVGYIQDNRTVEKALTLPYGTTMTYDMAVGFPAQTSKFLYFAGIRGEIIGFLRGLTNAHDFAALGCNWWMDDANANTEWLKSPWRTCDGDMGRAYGAQWRRWRTEDGFLDQVQSALDLIRSNPMNRRIMISAWRPDEFRKMCLPPCHVLYRFQVNVEAGELNMSMYQRSSDMHLGVPMNIAGGALMLHLFAAACGLKPRWFTHHLDDTHIYLNAMDAVNEVLTNDQHEPPRLTITKDLFGANADQLASIDPSEIFLTGYRFTPLTTEKVKMATG